MLTSSSSPLLPPPTPEQAAIFAAASALPPTHLIIDAKAGSGKTTTLIQLLPRLAGTSLILAFNKAIAAELQLRVQALALPFEQSINISASTTHSHGLAAFRRTGAKTTVSGGKVTFMAGDMFKAAPSSLRPALLANKRNITQLVSYAKSAGFGLTSTYEQFPSIDDVSAWLELAEHFGLAQDLKAGLALEQAIDYAQRLLKQSNKRLSQLDFDDMIYLPLLLNMPLTPYHNVLLDEAQDINATRRELAFRSLAPGGRMIAVGDPSQAIYGFTGAAADGMSRIAARATNAIELPLSICWRCDAAIIAEAQKIVPSIQPRPGAFPGLVHEFLWQPAAVGDSVNDPGPAGDFLALPRPGDAVLCRLNKPNVAVALALITRNQPARIEGRDLGNRLLSHAKRACPLYASTPLAELLPALTSHLRQETLLLEKLDKLSAIAMLEDEIGAVQLLITRCLEQAAAATTAVTWSSLEALTEQLFGDDLPSAGLVTLSSVHKAKGREWSRVFILGREDYMPFHRARSSWEREQEQNLIYVAVTRARHELYLINGVEEALEAGLHRAPALPAVPSTSNQQ